MSWRGTGVAVASFAAGCLAAWAILSRPDRTDPPTAPASELDVSHECLRATPAEKYVFGYYDFKEGDVLVVPLPDGYLVGKARYYVLIRPAARTPDGEINAWFWADPKNLKINGDPTTPYGNAQFWNHSLEVVVLGRCIPTEADAMKVAVSGAAAEPAGKGRRMSYDDFLGSREMLVFRE